MRSRPWQIPRRLLWARRRPDIGWRDLAAGLLRTFRPLPGAPGAVESQWPAAAHPLACLSVRSGLDLLLRALRLPPGSEVLMSALTIPGMVRVVEENGLVCVPLDLEGSRLWPDPRELEARATPRARLVVLAALFGSRPDPGPLCRAARRLGLLVVEDRAQAFAGIPPDPLEHCDAALYSFGPIKRATALGGAVALCRDPELAREMRDLQQALPEQPGREQRRRVLAHALLKLMALRLPFTLLALGLALGGRDRDAWLHARVRNLDGDRFLAGLRRRPSPALLSLLSRRLARFGDGGGQAGRGRRLARRIPLPVAGGGAPEHGFDLFPLLARDPRGLVRSLGREGFDACMRGSLSVVAPPPGREEARQASGVLESLVFLPLYGAMPPREADRMAARIREEGDQSGARPASSSRSR